MATCKECLHFEVCVAFMNSEIDFCHTLDESREKYANDDVCDLFMATADVVPRAEVEWLLEDFQGSIRADAMVGMSAGEILMHIHNMLTKYKKKYIGDKR